MFPDNKLIMPLIFAKILSSAGVGVITAIAVAPEIINVKPPRIDAKVPPLPNQLKILANNSILLLLNNLDTLGRINTLLLTALKKIAI